MGCPAVAGVGRQRLGVVAQGLRLAISRGQSEIFFAAAQATVGVFCLELHGAVDTETVVRLGWF